MSRNATTNTSMQTELGRHGAIWHAHRKDVRRRNLRSKALISLMVAGVLAGITWFTWPGDEEFRKARAPQQWFNSGHKSLEQKFLTTQLDRFRDTGFMVGQRGGERWAALVKKAARHDMQANLQRSANLLQVNLNVLQNRYETIRSQVIEKDAGEQNPSVKDILRGVRMRVQTRRWMLRQQHFERDRKIREEISRMEKTLVENALADQKAERK